MRQYVFRHFAREEGWLISQEILPGTYHDELRRYLFRLESERARETFIATNAATVYRGTSIIRNSASLGPWSRTMPRALRWS